MKVIIAGSRDIEDYDLVKKAIADSGFEITQVISGNCRGVDLLGERFAAENNLPVELHPADWEKFGRSAGPRRNAEMAKVADALIAVMRRDSRGTKNMVMNAEKRGLKMHVVIID